MPIMLVNKFIVDKILPADDSGLALCIGFICRQGCI